MTVVTRRRECPFCDCCLDAAEPATHGLDEEGGCRIESKDSQLLLPVDVSLYSMDSVSSLALLQSASIPGRKSIGGGGSSRPVSHSVTQPIGSARLSVQARPGRRRKKRRADSAEDGKRLRWILLSQAPDRCPRNGSGPGPGSVRLRSRLR